MCLYCRACDWRSVRYLSGRFTLLLCDDNQTGACAYLSGTGLFGIGRASGTWGWRWIPRFFCRLFYFYIIPIISVITGPVYLFFLPAIHPATRKSFNVRLVNLNHLGFILSARMRDFHYGIYLRRQLVAVER